MPGAAVVGPTTCRAGAGRRRGGAKKRRRHQQAQRQRCADRGNNLAVRGLANLYRAESPEKASAGSPAFLPPSGAVSMISERSLTNDRLEKQAQA